MDRYQPREYEDYNSDGSEEDERVYRHQKVRTDKYGRPLTSRMDRHSHGKKVHFDEPYYRAERQHKEK